MATCSWCEETYTFVYRGAPFCEQHFKEAKRIDAENRTMKHLLAAQRFLQIATVASFIVVLSKLLELWIRTR